MLSLITNLPIELLSYILTFIDGKFEKKIKFYPKDKILFNKVIKEVIFIPSKLSLINKTWYTAVLYSKCRICNTGSYNFRTLTCIKCGHIMESKQKKVKRIKRIKN